MNANWMDAIKEKKNEVFNAILKLIGIIYRFNQYLHNIHQLMLHCSIKVNILWHQFPVISIHINAVNENKFERMNSLKSSSTLYIIEFVNY